VRKKLIVIGASYLQRPLVVKAKEMGIETHVFAWEEGAVVADACDYFYPISIVEKEAILQKAKEIQPDGIISIASDLAAVTVNYLAGMLGLIGNSMEVTRNTTNKYLMRSVLSQAHIRCPGFHRLDRSTDLEVIDLNYPAIVKPVDRSGSRGVTRISDPSFLREAADRALEESFFNEAIVEEFIFGRQEISVEMISWLGTHHFLAITEKVTTGSPYYVESQQHQPAEVSSSLRDKIIDTVSRTLTCLGLQYGASHSELLITADDELYIVEIGARMGGDFIGSDLVRLSTGYDFIRGVIEVSLGDFKPVEKPIRKYAGVYYANGSPGLVTEIVDRTADFPQIIQKEIFIQEGDQVGEVKESGDRMGYFIYHNSEKFLLPEPAPIEIVAENLKLVHHESI
jgi:biotin carboxylase